MSRGCVGMVAPTAASVKEAAGWLVAGGAASSADFGSAVGLIASIRVSAPQHANALPVAEPHRHCSRA